MLECQTLFERMDWMEHKSWNFQKRWEIAWFRHYRNRIHHSGCQVSYVQIWSEKTEIMLTSFSIRLKLIFHDGENRKNKIQMRTWMPEAANSNKIVIETCRWIYCLELGIRGLGKSWHFSLCIARKIAGEVIKIPLIDIGHWKDVCSREYRNERDETVRVSEIFSSLLHSVFHNN